MTLLRLGVFGAACLVYLNSLGNGFALDDVVIILQNPRVHDVTAMRQIWLTPYWPDHGAQFGLWRPFAIYAYAIQWAVGGGSPLVFHVVSVALHALVSVLVFSLLNRLTATMPAFWGALIFAIHPVHTEAVANVVGQAELIAAASVLMACVAHASRRSGAGPPRRSVLLIGVLFAVAVMTKEHAVVLPALLVLVDLAQRRVQPSSQAVLAYARSMAGLAALLSGLTLAYLVVRYHVLDGSLVGQHAGPQLHYLHGEHRLVNALRAFPEYLRLLVWPASLAADYSPAMILPVDSISPMVVVGALLLAALAAMAVAAPWLAGVALPAAWLLVSLLTVSNFFFPVGVLVAERALYLPSFALSAAVAYGLFRNRHQWALTTRRAVTAVLVLACTLGSYRTWVRNPDWQSTLSIQQALVRDHPESYKAQWTQAAIHWQLERLDQAAGHFELAVRIFGHDSDLLADYGDFLLQRGENDRGRQILERARRIHPGTERTTFLLGNAHLAAGDFDAALYVARAGRAHGVDPAIALPIEAAALDGLARTDEALNVWRQVVRQGRLTPGQWAHLAATLAARGAHDDALAAIARGVAAAGDDETARRRLQQARLRILEGRPGIDP
jgi:protein O-mannosyl-transferase